MTHSRAMSVMIFVALAVSIRMILEAHLFASDAIGAATDALQCLAGCLSEVPPTKVEP